MQGQGYIAQALAIADVLAVAWFRTIRYRPEESAWEGRDRFLLSNGHYAMMCAFMPKNHWFRFFV